jgi:hypothetical protein
VGIHSIGHHPIAFQLTNESDSYLHQYLVDGGANVRIICNHGYIWDFHDIKSTTISGVGHMQVTQAGNCAFGHALFDSSMKFNLIAQWQVEDRHQSKKDTSLQAATFWTTMSNSAEMLGSSTGYITARLPHS